MRKLTRKHCKAPQRAGFIHRQGNVSAWPSSAVPSVSTFTKRARLPGPTRRQSCEKEERTPPAVHFFFQFSLLVSLPRVLARSIAIVASPTTKHSGPRVGAHSNPVDAAGVNFVPLKSAGSSSKAAAAETQTVTHAHRRSSSQGISGKIHTNARQETGGAGFADDMGIHRGVKLENSKRQR